MSNGMVMLAIGTIFCVTEIAMGTYIYRNADRLAPAGKPPRSLRTLGRVQIAAGPIILAIVAALAFGLIPTHVIQPIQF